METETYCEYCGRESTRPTHDIMVRTLSTAPKTAKIATNFKNCDKLCLEGPFWAPFFVSWGVFPPSLGAPPWGVFPPQRRDKLG